VFVDVPKEVDLDGEGVAVIDRRPVEVLIFSGAEE
jgi:hypothetical protein